MDWKGVWNDIKNFFVSNAWNILWFFLTLILGIIIIKIFINILRRIFSKTKMEKIAQNFLLAIIKFILYLILVLILLSIMGIQITGILTALSAVVLAIGMALESNIANLANGIVIVSTHMFKKGDYISVNGVEGSITQINFLFTTLTTVDNKRVTIPNSTIVNSAVINNGSNPKRRVDITFSVAYESDVELVKKIVTDVMKSNGKVYLDPEPFCRLKVLGSSSLDFFSNCWVDNDDYWDVYYYVIENVYNEFKRNNISVPFNQVEVRERKDEVVMPVIGEGLPERVEKIRKIEKHFDLENDDIIAEIKKKRAAKRKASGDKRVRANNRKDKLDNKTRKSDS